MSANVSESGNRLLEIEDLHTYFRTRDGVVKAVDGVTLHVDRGEILGLVGESGCGKSVTSLSIMQLISPPGKIESGRILFNGVNLLELTGNQIRKIRGRQIAMIFQQPTSSLNPVLRAGFQIAEVLEIHDSLGKKAGRERAIEMLEKVGVPDPEQRVDSYPHELSGGMAQRVMIAMALASVPDLLIADEPTTALDVTIQAQILYLMRSLQSELGTSIILITHDLGVVADMADRIAVMYAGEIVEQTDTKSLFKNPQHPYTQGLIDSIPILGKVKEELEVIPGNVPSLIDMPVGCHFADRCKARVEHGLEICTQQKPELKEYDSGHYVRCWLYEPGAK